jgi:hypothetical protein
MAVERQHAESVHTRLTARSLNSGGTRGNELLTSLTGCVLIALLAVIGVTIISLTRLLWIHLFVGMLLIGPVVLKLSSTGYRFFRYYTANPRYRRKGPPPLALRLIAPIVVVTTLVVFASGVALLFIGPSSRDTLLPIHKVSFFVWLAFTAIHVLAHLPTIAGALRSEYLASSTRSSATAGRAGRALSLTAALTAGVVLAVVVIPQFAPWISSQRFHH